MRFLILTLLLAAPLSAQQIEWTNVGGPPGGLLPVLHTTESGALLAVDEIGRMGRSTDEGDTWSIVDLSGVNGFSNAPGETLAATDVGVYHSTDDGAMWTLLASSPQPLHSVARVTDATLLATATSSRREDLQYLTQDDGSTWDLIGVGGSHVFRGQNGVVYAAGAGQRINYTRQSRLLEWNDAAARWDTLAGPNVDGRFSAQVRAIDALSDGTIFVATGQQGTLWCSLGGLHVRSPQGDWAIYRETEISCYGPSTPDWQTLSMVVRGEDVLVGRHGQVDRYVPTGAGAYQLDQSYDVPGDAAVYALTANDSRILASSARDCFILIDGPGECTTAGVAGIDRSSGLSSEVGFGMQKVRVLNSSLYRQQTLALTDFGVWGVDLSCRGAQCRPDWESIVSPSVGHPDLATRVERSPWIYLSGGEGDGLVVTSDIPFGYSGSVWEEGKWRYLDSEYGGVSLTAGGDSLLFATSERDGTFLSVDRGRTVERVSERGFFELKFDYFTGGQLLAGGEDGVYASADSGATWEIWINTAKLGPVRSIKYGASELRLAKTSGGATPIPLLGVLAGHTVFRWMSNTIVEPGEGWTLPDSVDLESARLVDVIHTCVATRTELWCPTEGTGEMERIYRSSPGERRQMLAAVGVQVEANEYRAVVASARGVLVRVQPVFVAEAETLAPANPGLIVHPNPVANRAGITLPPQATSATIFDAMGRRIARLDVTATTTEWDASGSAPGIYFVRVETPSGPVSRALVVVR